MTKAEFKEFVGKVTDWYHGQYGACCCLGNCKECGHHICFGCACWMKKYIDVKEEDAESNS
jgi:hypothetical protein